MKVLDQIIGTVRTRGRFLSLVGVYGSRLWVDPMAVNAVSEPFPGDLVGDVDHAYCRLYLTNGQVVVREDQP